MIQTPSSLLGSSAGTSPPALQSLQILCPPADSLPETQTSLTSSYSSYSSYSSLQPSCPPPHTASACSSPASTSGAESREAELTNSASPDSTSSHQREQCPEAERRRLFDALAREHRATAYRLAYRLLGNCSEAEDAAQEALVRAWWHFGSFDATRPFEVWLLRIVRNLCIDYHRRRKHRMALSLDTPTYGDKERQWLHNLLADSSSDPQAMMMASRLDERVQDALNALSEEHRRALLLVGVHRCSYEKAADILGCALGTVRSRVHRARRSLRRSLAL